MEVVSQMIVGCESNDRGEVVTVGCESNQPGLLENISLEYCGKELGTCFIVCQRYLGIPPVVDDVEMLLI